MIGFINFLDAHSTLITATSIIVGGFWALLKFREYLKDKRFITYHKLIDDLVNEQAQPGKIIKLDRQIAIIYELRNYSSYYSVSKRILTGLKENEWKNNDKRILDEIKFTLEFISSKWFCRIWKRFRKF